MARAGVGVARPISLAPRAPPRVSQSRRIFMPRAGWLKPIAVVFDLFESAIRRAGGCPGRTRQTPNTDDATLPGNAVEVAGLGQATPAISGRPAMQYRDGRRASREFSPSLADRLAGTIRRPQIGDRICRNRVRRRIPHLQYAQDRRPALVGGESFPAFSSARSLKRRSRFSGSGLLPSIGLGSL